MKAGGSGFTLIELLVVVAIVAAIAAFAVPAYESHVMSSEVKAAQTAMLACANDLQSWAQDHETFVGACQSPPQATNFTISCSGLSANAYVVTATGTGMNAGFTFTLDQTGMRATTGAPSGWATNATCWVSDKQGDCAPL